MVVFFRSHSGVVDLDKIMVLQHRFWDLVDSSERFSTLVVWLSRGDAVAPVWLFSWLLVLYLHTSTPITSIFLLFIRSVFETFFPYAMQSSTNFVPMIRA